MDVGCPFKLRSVCMPGADIAGLKLLKLLLCAQFISLVEMY